MALQGSPRAYLGIDMGTHAIKIVELIDRGRHIELATYAHAYRTPADYTSASARKLSATLSHMIEQAQVSADTAVMALPNSAIFTFPLIVPQLPEDELNNLIRLKARHMVPVDLDEVELMIEQPAVHVLSKAHHQHHRAGAFQDQSSAKRLPGRAAPPPAPVFVTAVPKAVSEWMRTVAATASVEVTAVEPEVFSFLRIHGTNRDSAVLICNIGGHESTFHLIDRSHPFASQNRAVGTEHMPDHPETISRITGLARQIVSRFESEHHRPLNRVIVAGGGAKAPSIRKALARALQLHVTISNPFSDLTVPQGIESKLHQIGPQLTVATGLARRHI